jgi:hypothetical protein
MSRGITDALARIVLSLQKLDKGDRDEDSYIHQNAMLIYT